MIYDIAVIGGGVIGGTILRELSKYNIKAILLEKCSDVAMGQSKANSGIVHAGFDAKPNTLKAKFNVAGNKMMPKYAKELGVKYKNNYSLVVAFSQKEMKTLGELLARGKKNGVKKLSIIDRERLKKLEPNISKNACGALLAKTGGIICPYLLTIASIGNAMDNGARLKCNFEVDKIVKLNSYFEIISKDKKEVLAKTIINCAGGGSQKIADLCGDDTIKIGYRRGEYILLDNECNNFVSHTLFFCPTEKGKGILISNTVDGNILLGPTADEIENDNTDTTSMGLEIVQGKAKEMADNIPFGSTITSFAGVRAYSKDRHDFIIENSSKVKGLINVCGIESPGLTSAPAIAKYVVENLIPPEYRLSKNANFKGKRKAENWFKMLSIKQKNRVIKSNSAFGKIVCRCEKVTEGEVVESIHQNPKATTIDAVKRRTRSGMGRCQGGFCSTRIAEILSRELNIPLENVEKGDSESKVVIGRTK